MGGRRSNLFSTIILELTIAEDKVEGRRRGRRTIRRRCRVGEGEMEGRSR